MNKLLKLSSGQLFLLLIGLPILLNVLDVIFSPGFDFSVIVVMPIIYLISFSLLLAWVWAAGLFLHGKLPEGLSLNLSRFKFLIIIAQLSLVVAKGLNFLLMVSDFNLLELKLMSIPLQLIFVVCLLYNFYFIAKALKSIENQRQASIKEFLNEFMLLVIYPVGLWFIQPKLNSI